MNIFSQKPEIHTLDKLPKFDFESNQLAKVLKFIAQLTQVWI
jgi:hypothetical protein